MPIRFPCPHCRQKLSISSKKSGAQATCPRCGKELTVPIVQHVAAADASTSEPAPPPVAPQTDPEDDPYAQFAVYDETELVYDTAAPATTAPQTPPLARRIALPRYVLLTQGILLGVVALLAFALGLATGGSFLGRQAQLAGAPCEVSGTIFYASGGRTVPDAGAVVLFLPQTKDPGRAIAAEGLRPEEPLPDAPLAATEELRNLGGAYTRTDDNGRYQVQLAEPGTYFVLVLSRHARRGAGQDIQTQDLVRLRRFVENAGDLLADSRYQFTTESVRGSRQLNAVFD
ncbi:MAG TPA: hypothetical protein VMP01_07265 [Pirellulaceae bacterium]|nr:hypothetical protein [Pirellulaceae bacterium]